MRCFMRVEFDSLSIYPPFRHLHKHIHKVFKSLKYFKIFLDESKFSSFFNLNSLTVLFVLTFCINFFYLLL